MKIKVVSDLHLEMCEHGHGVPDPGEGEVLILGGDILCAKHFKRDGQLHKVYDSFLAKCSANFDKILYVAGNHEAYGYNYEGAFDVIREALPANIQLMENDTITIGDWVFIGGTLWTNFRNANPLEMMEAEQCMNDYKAIRTGSNFRKLRANDTLAFHLATRNYILDELERVGPEAKVWVLTHHGPSYQSVAEMYRSSGIANGAYVSDLDQLILAYPQILYWSHGHTHTSFDYTIGQCRVICNPRGYYNGYNNHGLNLDFNPNFTIEVN